MSILDGIKKILIKM